MATQIQTSGSLGHDLITLIERVDRILTTLHVMQSLECRGPGADGRIERINFAEIMHLHVEMMVTDLGAVKSSADIVDDKRVGNWIDEAGDDDEKAKREMLALQVLRKVGELEKAMADAKLIFTENLR
ncbi:hypothetical protein NX059_009914 [Plenodomus lindquistii]|nr:hypothetical protein NX059_009914 [Plenodomus lindquistii]